MHSQTTSKVLTGNYGTILYRQINGYYNTCRYYHCFIDQAGYVPCLEMEDRPFFFINLKDTITFRFGDYTELPFYEWGANLFNLPAESGGVIFRKEGEYAFFTIHFDTEYLHQFVLPHGQVKGFLQSVANNKANVLNDYNFPANTTMRNAISEILYCEYSDAYYDVYLMVKCHELLIPFLRQCVTETPVVTIGTVKEVEAIYRVRKKMMAEMHEQHTVEGLALFAHLSEYKLKYGFRQIYGMLIFDFLHEVRMKKAYLLVASTQIPYDTIAGLVGYQSVTTFYNQFKKYTGMSPKRLRDGTGKGTKLNMRIEKS